MKHKHFYRLTETFPCAMGGQHWRFTCERWNCNETKTVHSSKFWNMFPKDILIL